MKEERKKKIFFFAMIILYIVSFVFMLYLLTSCRTVYVSPELPEYKLENIERPVITEKSDDIIKLMRYAEKKEIQLNNFKLFYDKLRQDNGNK